MAESFYLIRGVRKGGNQTGELIVFENQLGTAVARLLTRPDLIKVEVQCSNEKDWMRYQKKRKDEKG